MMLMEYMARNLLAEKGIPVPQGMVIRTPEDVREGMVKFPAVLKAQVPAGGRGKTGGIKVVNDLAAARETARQMLGMEIKGHKVECLLLAEKIEYERELFLSIILDRKAKTPVVIFSSNGGMDIEDVARVAPERVIRAPINVWTGVREYTVRYLLGRADLDSKAAGPPAKWDSWPRATRGWWSADNKSNFSASLSHACPAQAGVATDRSKYAGQLSDVLQRLYQVYQDYDCLLAEINPLMIDRRGKMIAADAKIDIDENALVLRQPALLAMRDELEREPAIKEARRAGFLLIPIHEDGDFAVMSNGSGMLMASLDALQCQKCKARVALDLGGGATASRIADGIGIVMRQPGVKGLFVNIFGGITRCDEVGAGVKDALGRISPQQFITLRMEGTNKEQGKEMLKSLPDRCFILVNSLREATEVMRERMQRP